jgi:hypothetical protein
VSGERDFILFLFNQLKEKKTIYDIKNVAAMKETPRRRITVTSSLNEIPTDQLGNRVRVRGVKGYSGRPPPPPFSTADFWTIFRKTT